MRQATPMGLAFVDAAVKAQKHWVAKQVIDRVQHTQQGTKAIQPIRVNVCPNTARKIKNDCGVLV